MRYLCQYVLLHDYILFDANFALNCILTPGFSKVLRHECAVAGERRAPGGEDRDAPRGGDGEHFVFRLLTVLLWFCGAK